MTILAWGGIKDRSEKEGRLAALFPKMRMAEHGHEQGCLHQQVIPLATNAVASF
jgi:hypothetical protein